MVKVVFSTLYFALGCASIFMLLHYLSNKEFSNFKRNFNFLPRKDIKKSTIFKKGQGLQPASKTTKTTIKTALSTITTKKQNSASKTKFAIKDVGILATISDEQKKAGVPFAFIKTHKTGSSVLRTAFKHYLDRKKLKRVFPLFPKSMIGGYPGFIDERFIINFTKNEKPYEAFLEHSRFHRKNMEKFMSPITRYISVMRKPWNQFQSSFYYYYPLPNERIITRWLKDAICLSYPFFQIAHGKPIRFLEYFHLAKKNLNSSIPWFFKSKNYQAYDLGLNPLLEDETKIKQAVKSLSKDIDFMVITEYMDESMVLLMDQLGMNSKDVKLKSSNINLDYESIEPTGKILTDFNEMYKLDIALYDHFNTTLWKKINKYGRQKMDEALKKLRQKKRKSEAHSPVKDVTGVSPAYKSFAIKVQNLTQHEILRLKLKREAEENQFYVSDSYLDDITDYMISNHGGCHDPAWVLT